MGVVHRRVREAREGVAKNGCFAFILFSNFLHLDLSLSPRRRSDRSGNAALDVFLSFLHLPTCLSSLLVSSYPRSCTPLFILNS